MQILLFNECNPLIVTVSEDDWVYLCQNRFLTNNPTDEQIEAEFVSGTGVTPNKPWLWDKASQLFAEYIAELKEIQEIDINAMARELIIEE